MILNFSKLKIGQVVKIHRNTLFWKDFVGYIVELRSTSITVCNVKRPLTIITGNKFYEDEIENLVILEDVK